MVIIADTHVHFYPGYHLGFAVDCLVKNMDARAADLGHSPGERPIFLAYMTERKGCHFFSTLADGRNAGAARGDRKFDYVDNGRVLVLYEKHVPRVYLIPGRQINTQERIEVLGLAMEGVVEDGLPIREVLQTVRRKGGVPVLGWSPGKWMFHRGKIVRELIENAKPGELLVSDTPLRPAGFGEPFLMRLAQERGLSVIQGSDALPLAGEEDRLGTYVSVFDSAFDEASPFRSAQTLLNNSRLRHTACGSRLSLPGVFIRLVRNVFASQKAMEKSGISP